MSRPRRKPLLRRAHAQGFVLIALLVLLTMGGLYFFVSNLTPEAVAARRQAKTEAALVQAREALIGYALQYRDQQVATGTLDAMYGFLPMPDVGTSRFHPTGQPFACNTEGCAMSFINGAFPSATETIIGRLPWRTLGIEPLRDGYGECLWYLVSAGHKSLGMNVNAVMNWDTVGHIDIVTTNDTADLQSLITSAHNRPLAIIFAPGPLFENQVRGRIGSDVVTQCNGNYNPANYLEPSLATTILDNDLSSTSSYFSGAIPTTTSSTSLLAISTQGEIVKNSTSLRKACPTGTSCSTVANDIGLPITSDTLFGQIIKNRSFRNDLKVMLNRMAECWSTNIASLVPVSVQDYTPPPDKIAGRIPDAPASCLTNLSTAYGNDRDPKGYFNHYREMIFIARPEPAGGTFTVNGDSTCKGTLLFSGPRGAGQQRYTVDDKKALGNYLEGDNLQHLTSTGIAFSGDSPVNDAPPRASGADMVLCIPSPSSGPPVAGSSTLANIGLGQLVAYDATTRTLTLGKANVVTGNSAIGASNAAALFGCAWIEDNVALGNGGRIYFRFQFKKVGTNVGTNGFVFALADAVSNSTSACGAAGSHLGYSGDNGATPKITFPKIGIEFDQSRNNGFSENLTNPGRNDPCGTTGVGCAGLGYNSHAAIVYWGNAQANATDLVTLPDNDDNVHGFPGTPPGTRPPPANPDFPSPGFAFTDMRGKTSLGGDSNVFHVRVELRPTRSVAATAENSNTVVQTKVWILPDSPTVANQITAMQTTTRPMSILSPGFIPTLQDTATLYDIADTGSSCNTSSPCPTGQACGADNMCYRPALQTLQVGFTNSQRTTDQEVPISDFTATWLP